MLRNFLLLKQLLYIELSAPAFDMATEHCFAMQSGSTLPFCNRVCGTSATSIAEIAAIRAFYGNIPFRWFVEDTNSSLIQLLEQTGFQHQVTYPTMIIDLVNVQPVNYDAEITVREIGWSDLSLWLEIVMRSYTISSEAEFAKFINYLIERAVSGSLKFYGAYYQTQPVAVSMTIRHQDVVGLHWVGTLPEYRGKGLGYAVSHQPLLDARQQGCKQAILLASELGKSVYDKIGFKQYSLCKVYR